MYEDVEETSWCHGIVEVGSVNSIDDLMGDASTVSDIDAYDFLTDLVEVPNQAESLDWEPIHLLDWKGYTEDTHDAVQSATKRCDASKNQASLGGFPSQSSTAGRNTGSRSLQKQSKRTEQSSRTQSAYGDILPWPHSTWSSNDSSLDHSGIGNTRSGTKADLFRAAQMSSMAIASTFSPDSSTRCVSLSSIISCSSSPKSAAAGAPISPQLKERYRALHRSSKRSQSTRTNAIALYQWRQRSTSRSAPSAKRSTPASPSALSTDKGSEPVLSPWQMDTMAAVAVAKVGHRHEFETTTKRSPNARDTLRRLDRHMARQRQTSSSPFGSPSLYRVLWGAHAGVNKSHKPLGVDETSLRMSA